MQCPQCRSENVQRLEVAYYGGTKTIDASSHTAGVGSISGMLGLSGSVTNTTGVSQSLIAHQSSPPLKKSFKWSVIAIIVGLLFMSGSGGWMVFGGLLLISGVTLAIIAAKFNSEQWPSMYELWRNSWVCHKCGCFYHHD